MDDDEIFNREVRWIPAVGPMGFDLTTKGDLALEYGVELQGPGRPATRMGLVIPAAEVKNLSAFLDKVGTTPETLSAVKPEQGAH